MKKIKTHTLVGGVLIAVLLVLAVVAAVWTPYNPRGIDLRAKLQPGGRVRTSRSIWRRIGVEMPRSTVCST